MNGELSEKTLAQLCLAAVCVLWGTTYFAIRIAVLDLPPALFCSVRYPELRSARLGSGFLWGAAGPFASSLVWGYGSYIYALSKLPTAQVAIYAYINPIVAILLGVRYLGERLDPVMKLGVPLVLAGVYLVNAASGEPILSKIEAEIHPSD